MKKRTLLLLISAVLLTGCTVEETDEEPIPKKEVVPVTEISAADDFYGYVNLEKLDTLEISYGNDSAGSFNHTEEILQDEIDGILTEIIESEENFPKGSNAQLIKDYYNLYLATDSPSEDAEEFIDGLMKKVDEVSDVSGYVNLMGELYHNYGVKLIFSFNIDASLYKPDSYMTLMMPKTNLFGRDTLKAIVEDRSMDSFRFMSSVLRSQGIEKEEAEERAKKAVFMFVDIADDADFDFYEDIYGNVDAIDIYSFEDAEKLFPTFSLRAYFEALDVELPKELHIGDVETMKTLGAAINEENLQILKDYAKSEIFAAYGNELPDKYRSFRSKYFPQKVAIKEKEAFDATENMFGEELSEIYADTRMSEEVIEKAGELCEDMRTAYFDLIKNADWLSEEARRLISIKLENMVFMIGGEGEGAVNPKNDIIGKDLLETKINLVRKNFSEIFANINKPYDRNRFSMPAAMVNACYNPSNTITIPYAILNEPFFDVNASEAENLGGIGEIIAHEMSHAFDSNCIVFDMNGFYNPDWIPEADVLAFRERMDMVEAYYNEFTIMDVYHVDGKLTLGENFADLGSFECIMSIVKTDDEKKQLMEKFADTWCSLVPRNMAIELLHEDVHSPDMVRVNAVIASCDEYYRLYDVKEGDGMYIPPEKRVSRW